MAKGLAAILAAYMVLLVATSRWHWGLGPPHTQASFALMVAFGLCAALVGLSSVSIALATLHWTRRASGLIVGVAVLALFWTPHFDWDGFLIWQVLVMFGVQTGGLVVTLGIASALGRGLGRFEEDGRGDGQHRPNKALQFSITDFLIFAAALAFLCAAIRGSRPVDLGTRVYLINIAGGACAAVVALTVLWACFGRSPAFARLSALVLISPTGGLVYALALRYASLMLLFNWRWYAGVTTAQVVFMAIPCLVLRAGGYRFLKGGPADRRVG